MCVFKWVYPVSVCVDNIYINSASSFFQRFLLKKNVLERVREREEKENRDVYNEFLLNFRR